MTDPCECNVAFCRYIANATIEGFPVCALHDHNATRGIIEEFMMPGMFTGGDDRPIVLPIRDLEERDFVQRKPRDGKDAIQAYNCPKLANVPSGASSVTHRKYDLTR